jgi:hypothetical protein
MKTTQCLDSTSSLATAELRACLQGDVLQPGDHDYPGASQVWNGAVNHQPAIIARCQTAGDVQQAVGAARRHNLPLSVRGGGHDWAGRALRHQGLVIDLTGMRQVRVDAAAETATVAGGATANDLATAAAAHDLAAITPNVSSVGMTGFLLAGGYGPLTTRFGLAIDNLLAADIVLADGRLITASPAQNADLFWALRGGGGNFGVVTSMQVRLHPVRQLCAGIIVFPWSQAEAILHGHAAIMADAPEELSVLVLMACGPDGMPLLILAPVWTGDPARGPKIMTCLQELGTPLLTQVGPMRYPDLLRIFDTQVVSGRHYGVKTRWLPDLSPGTITAMVEAFAARTSPFACIAVHHCHGPAAHLPIESTAFGLRREHFMMEIVAAWDPDDAGRCAQHRAWMTGWHAAFAPYALPGGYPNFLLPEDREQIASAYGSNAGRLLALKRWYDPDNIFASATPLPD